MMIEFSDVNEHKEQSHLSSVAMEFDGKIIEDELKGYRTLNVSGRETVAYDYNTAGGISGRDGELFISKKLLPRVIEVQYQLVSESAIEFQEKIDRLIGLLHSADEVPVRFVDEYDKVYYGQLETFSSVPPDSLAIVSAFTIRCSDAYKYDSREKAIEGNPVGVYIPNSYGVVPDLIKVKIRSTRDKLIVRNQTTAKRIIINGTFTNGHDVVIDIKNKRITQNGQNIMARLDYTESDFNQFVVNANDEVSTNQLSDELQLVIRSRWK